MHMTRKITMKGVFNLLERLSMSFPKGKTDLDDKVRFEENINFLLKSSNGHILEGK